MEKYNLTTFPTNFDYTFLNNTCKNNNSIDVIKYLIQTFKLDIHHSIERTKWLSLECENDSNINLAKYLIEETDITISSIYEATWKKIMH